MAASAQLYRNAPNDAALSLWTSDAFKVMLCTSSYTPDANAHKTKNDITNEISGTGYTAGGAALGSPTKAFTAANSWATTWTALTAYTVGQIIRPATGNGHLYVCVVAGTSGATAPTFPTASRNTVIDATATWAECGGGINIFSAANTSWTAATFTARYAVIYDSTPSGAANQPLVGYIDFGADQSPNGVTFQLTWDATLGIFYLTVG